MRQKEVLVASIVGIAMFITDLKFSWLSMYLGTIPGLFVIAFVVGVLATDIGGGLLSAFVALVGGVAVSGAFFSYLFPEYWNPETTLAGVILFVVVYSVRNLFPDEEMSPAEAIGMFIVMLVLTPMAYGFCMVLGAIGGFVGRLLRENIIESRGWQPPAQVDETPTEEAPVEETSQDEPAFTVGP